MHDADFNMFAFYAVRGYTPDYFVDLGFVEKTFLHCAMEQFYKEENERYKALLGEK